ncbi:MAG TPA: N,N-dimethylformamidase beta subunit family domain-containing protein [Streptosporangiaceae bacterium]|nr:N,N-dimethylformamidase beta subunit family domain-containing protein [Streptosporangiaceae bacterium]
MTWAYATRTSVRQGETLAFVVGGAPADGTVRVHDEVSGELIHQDAYGSGSWLLPVGPAWRSSLYLAVFEPGPEQGDPVSAEDNEAYFVVRPAGLDRAPVLLSVPFATWQAYNRAGVPGEGLYWTEDPRRASRVSFDRPGGGPPPERWEQPMMRWLRRQHIAVDYCSNLDLHADPGLLDACRLLLVAGHDEYWTWEMRDAVESFTRRGGNLAIFGANTCWWQMRLEDGGRTMICYRDALADPASADGRPERTTVEWSSAPVCRPENAMTGLSYRLGAGCWTPSMDPMHHEEYTVRFADHWVFEGTGLADGDRFGRGCLGYETDAADLDDADGAPRVTGRDGTPGSFTVLATADLRHWAGYGQGGAATMGVFTSGNGTVFNAGTVNWGAALAEPVVARITRNVVSRLSRAPVRRPEWLVVGTRDRVHALAVAGSTLYAVVGDTPGTPFLRCREACAQNLPWRPIEEHRPEDRPVDIVALASPRDAVAGAPGGLYALHQDGIVLIRTATPDPAPWSLAGKCPAGARALAAANDHFFVLDVHGVIWSCPQGQLANGSWHEIDRNTGLVTMTGMNGRLYAADDAGRLLTRSPGPADTWRPAGDAGGCTVLTGHAGNLYGASPGLPLRRLVP